MAEDILPTNYNRDKAPVINGNAVQVNVSLYIIDLAVASGTQMTISVDMFIHVSWIDHRLLLPLGLNRNKTKITLDPQWKERLWIPDLHFTKAIKGYIVDILSPSLYFIVTNQTNILMVARLQMTMHCNMDFRNYPFDSQICHISLYSFSETEDLVQLNWNDFRIGNHFYLPHYVITDYVSNYCIKHNKVGEFSCLKANIYLSRNKGKFYLRRYIPSFLIVVMTFVGFWIPTNASPARVTLIVTSLLALIAQQIQNELNVSYIYALEIWNIICITFVFATLIEYAMAVCYDNTMNTNRLLFGVKLRIGEKNSIVDVVSRLIFPVTFFICILFYSLYYYYQE